MKNISIRCCVVVLACILGCSNNSTSPSTSGGTFASSFAGSWNTIEIANRWDIDGGGFPYNVHYDTLRYVSTFTAHGDSIYVTNSQTGEKWHQDFFMFYQVVSGQKLPELRTLSKATFYGNDTIRLGYAYGSSILGATVSELWVRKQ